MTDFAAVFFYRFAAGTAFPGNFYAIGSGGCDDGAPLAELRRLPSMTKPLKITVACHAVCKGGRGK
ncbi:MAG TPA: hypothetical protein VHB22_04925 [Hyphomicrobium sp.]|nr:hypothetical protein [Hyphomicrobium sp.]